MTLPAEATLLILDGMGVPLYSARGLTEKLEPIQAAKNLRRDIDGVLHDISIAAFRKYAVSISCTDVNAPALSGVWPGMQVTVHCVSLLGYGSGGTPERTAVSGSEFTVGDFTYYRPILVCRVMNDPMSTAEYSADVQWTLELEEK